MNPIIDGLLKVVVPHILPARKEDTASPRFEARNPISNGIMGWVYAHIFSPEEGISRDGLSEGRCRLCMHGNNTSNAHKVIHLFAEDASHVAAFLAIVAAVGVEAPYRGWEAAHRYYHGRTWGELAQEMQEETQEWKKETQEWKEVVQDRGKISEEIQALHPLFLNVNKRFEDAFDKRIVVVNTYTSHTQKALKVEMEFLQTLEKTCAIMETIRIEFPRFSQEDRKQLQLIVTIKIQIEELESEGKKLLQEMQEFAQNFERKIVPFVQSNAAAEEESVQTMRQISDGIGAVISLGKQLTFMPISQGFTSTLQGSLAFRSVMIHVQS